MAKDKSTGSSYQHQNRQLTSLEKGVLKGGISSFSDTELIELVVSAALPEGGVAELVKEITSRYDSVGAFLSAPASELESIPGITSRVVLHVRLIRELPVELLRKELISKPVHKSSKEIFNYLHLSMKGRKKEVLKVLYINNQNQIIETEDLFTGSVDGSAISPREVIESAIKHSASGLIFAHNHPAGNPTPSQNDKQVTRDLVYAAAIMQIKVLDHVVIGDNRYFSFAGDGLIEQYELDFLSLKIKGISEAKRRLYRARLFGGLDGGFPSA